MIVKNISTVLAVKIMAVITVVCLSAQVGKAENCGHRAGADCGTGLPENSIELLQVVLQCKDKQGLVYQDRPDFRYVEIDIRETKDGELVLFHDDLLNPTFPENVRNGHFLDKLTDSDEYLEGPRLVSICDLELAQLKQLTLSSVSRVKLPTLADFLHAAKQFHLRRPLIVEMKHLHSEQAKEKMIKLLADFRDDYMCNAPVVSSADKPFDFPQSVNFMAFESAFSSSLGRDEAKKKFWCERLAAHCFSGVFQAKKHGVNFCEPYLPENICVGTPVNDNCGNSMEKYSL